jgi:urocanate hydratase
VQLHDSSRADSGGLGYTSGYSLDMPDRVQGSAGGRGLQRWSAMSRPVGDVVRTAVRARRRPQRSGHTNAWLGQARPSIVPSYSRILL